MVYKPPTLIVEGEEFDKPLAPMTSWHIGGHAQRYYCPHDSASLSTYLSLLPSDISCTWLGLGSNVLIRDTGLQGSVICTRGLQRLFQQEDGKIVAEAGVTCAKFARFCTRLGFSDAAFFAGIPGTIGGALAMNAGAFGGETWQWVQSVQVMNRLGQIYIRNQDNYDIAYRSVKGKMEEQMSEAFISGTFNFQSRNDQDGLKKIRELLRKRNQTQPIGTLNCGSVYRNPPGDFAARLIEASGLKGYQIGGALISPKHANFIINSGQCCSQNVEDLMKVIEKEVLEQFGVTLFAEVRILGHKNKGI